jgi:hypothetical protein
VNIDRENFLTYLKDNHPYLYDIEKEIERINMVSGFGDISFVLRIQHGIVDSGEMLNDINYSIKGSAKKIYRKRKGNFLDES